MLRHISQALVKALLLIFQNCLNCSTFPDIWKESNILPAHKKMTKLFIIKELFGYFLYLGKHIFKSLFEYLDEQKLLSKHQSSFRPNEKINYYLLFITYTVFDADRTLEVVILYMSKAFDKVGMRD